MGKDGITFGDPCLEIPCKVQECSCGANWITCGDPCLEIPCKVQECSAVRTVLPSVIPAWRYLAKYRNAVRCELDYLR